VLSQSDVSDTSFRQAKSLNDVIEKQEPQKEIYRKMDHLTFMNENNSTEDNGMKIERYKNPSTKFSQTH
jgi:hypothetical protein